MGSSPFCHSALLGIMRGAPYLIPRPSVSPPQPAEAELELITEQSAERGLAPIVRQGQGEHGKGAVWLAQW